MEELVSELVAIWMWDNDYQRVRKHDQIDRMARDARRMRESEIIQIIVDSLLGSKSLTAS
jgi:hypothetical protein